MAKKVRLTTEQFIQRASEIHNEFYLYDKSVYRTSHDMVIIVCPLHGEFLQKAYRHLQGGGCSECGIRNRARSQHEWIQSLKQVHHNRYDYSLVQYIASNKKVKIKCSLHGVFEQEPQVHERGHGCKKCANKQQRTDGVYCEAYFNTHKDEEGIFYVASMKDDIENFVKIGITKNFDKRFNNKPYQVEPIIFQKMVLRDAFIEEQRILQEYEDLSYTPRKKFSGYTECFVPSIVERLLNG